MIIRTIKWRILTILMYLMRIFPIKQNKILFCSYRGYSYSCNPKYIAEKMNEYGRDLDIVWLLNDGCSLPKGMRRVSIKSIKKIYELATSRVWVDNCRMPLWVRKRKGQFYIQTWHAGISNKPGEKFTENKLTKDYIESAIRDSKMANLFLSNSKWLTDSYRNGFWYTGKILEKGLPREDVLLEDKTKYYDKVCKFYHVSKGTRFVLYAPTFRKSQSLECYNIDYYRLLNTLSKKYGGEWKVILRLHPNIRQENIESIYDNSILNGTDYDEINDLILASEILISDYSSCLFDAMIANIKVIMYASDIDDYSKDRGFFFKWEELPFPLAVDNDSLETEVMRFKDDLYAKSVAKFKQKCGYIHNGNASEEVSEYIIGILDKQEIV